MDLNKMECKMEAVPGASCTKPHLLTGSYSIRTTRGQSDDVIAGGVEDGSALTLTLLT